MGKKYGSLILLRKTEVGDGLMVAADVAAAGLATGVVGTFPPELRSGTAAPDFRSESEAPVVADADVPAGAEIS